jgi:hypothetical protein
LSLALWRPLLSVVYSQACAKMWLSAFNAKYLEAPDFANAAHDEALKRGEPADRARVQGEFAYDVRLGEAASLLPRRNIDQDDFSGLPVVKRGDQPSTVWWRTRLGGVWVIGAFRPPLDLDGYMLYRAHIVGCEQTDN